MTSKAGRPETVDAGELVIRALEGDHQAWGDLVERYTGMLWSIARSYDLGSADAADVVQTAWLRLVERLELIRDPGRVGSWLAVTAHRESLRSLRRQRREHPAAASPVPAVEPSPGPHHAYAQRERLRQVMAAFTALPERCRRLLRLCTEALSYEEIAAALGMPRGSVGPTRGRCLRHLHRHLTGGSAGISGGMPPGASS